MSPHTHHRGMLTRRQTLPFKKVAHRVTTLDAQPSSESGAILVMVTGALMVSLQRKTLPETIPDIVGLS